MLLHDHNTLRFAEEVQTGLCRCAQAGDCCQEQARAETQGGRRQACAFKRCLPAAARPALPLCALRVGRYNCCGRWGSRPAAGHTEPPR